MALEMPLKKECNEKSCEEMEPPDEISGRSSIKIEIQKNLVKTDRSEIKKFIKKYYGDTGLKEWDDWKWQIAHSITSIDKLSEILETEKNELDTLKLTTDNLPLRVTPYFASILKNSTDKKILKTVIPSEFENIFSKGENEDPLGEEHSSPVDGIVHRYPDRVLFLITNFCSTYCRYCTRSRMVGKKEHNGIDFDKIDRGIEYIKNNKVIRDVILSGGDPLTLTDDILEYILYKLRAIPHVEIIRIGTKVPVVLPQRINDKLLKMLKRYHPIWMSIHFIHPDEVSEEVHKACSKIADAGIPMGSQTVLLKNVNDDVMIMKSLFHKLLKARVRPYYIYQCDPIKGSAHFRTKVEKGLEIIKGIRGFTSGYAVPSYVIDAPEGGGKIPLLPEYYIGKDENNIILKNFEDKIYKYPENNGEV